MYCTVLTGEQIELIHSKSLYILDHVGVFVPHNETLDRFEEYGAKIDRSDSRVRIPPELVMSMIGKSGKQFTLYGRDKNRIAQFGYGKRNYNSSGGQAFWLDEVGKDRREPVLGDVKTAARIADCLGQINVVGAMADPQEIPLEVRCIEVTAELIKNTTKPIHHWFHDRSSAKFIVEIMIALRGSDKEAAKFPICYPFLEPISPLRFPFNGIDVLYETAKINLPVPVGPMAQTGLSAPATLAGTMAQENAEILAGICITQLISPGVPVCYGGICHAFDMSTTQLIFAGPEQAIYGVAMTQLGKYYGLPVYINSGMTDAKRPDAQAGAEIAATLVLAASAGADIYGHMGICGVDQGGSPDMLVFQNEIISYVESVTRTIEFSDETFAVDEIEASGPGGTFIDREHTVKHFRKELWFPELLDRKYFQQWLENGALSMEERCRQRKEGIIGTHEPEPVSPELGRALDKIVTGAKQCLLRKS
jgi:trimethylamine--corrinoid protein Co-methyltransferase